MKALTAFRLSVCLFALFSLAGCFGQHRVKPLPTPQIPAVIDNPIPAYQPLPAALTNPLAEPPAPPARCSYLGIPVVCVTDGLLWIEAWRGQLEHANVDRATAKAITTQPVPAHP